MFSAVYLVCMANSPCMFFVDTIPYPTLEVCEQAAENNIVRNSSNPEVPPFTAEYQCVVWDKA